MTEESKKIETGDILQQKVKNMTEELIHLNKRLTTSQQQTKDIANKILKLEGAITEFKKVLEELSRDSMTQSKED